MCARFLGVGNCTCSAHVCEHVYCVCVHAYMHILGCVRAQVGLGVLVCACLSVLSACLRMSG